MSDVLVLGTDTNDVGDDRALFARAAKVQTIAVDLARPDARALCMKLKREPRTANVPLVALVWNAGLYDQIVAANYHADAYAVRGQDLSTQQPVNPIYRQYVVGRSPAMVELLGLCAKVAPTPMNLLIEGESGAGKDILARVIHSASKLRHAPFVAVNCAAIPATLLESEFFGHVKGAFTDAKADRAGFFQVADGGTLFLDEIGELPLEFQAKLLRAVETGEVRPVGSSAAKQFAVRIVSATNRTLAREVEAGRFRQDLFFRLQQFHVRAPSLHERREDIAVIVDHFLHESGAGLTSIEPRALAVLETYRFPGNVRELRSLIQSLQVLAEPPAIKVEDLPRYIRAGAITEEASEPVLHKEMLTLEVDLNQGLKLVLTDVMAKVLRAYLALAGGIIKDAATLAKVPVPTWYRKVREADLTREMPEE